LATNPTLADGYKLSTSSEQVTFDYDWKRIQGFTFQVYDPDNLLANLLGKTGTARFYDAPHGNEIESINLSGLTSAGGATLSILAADFADLQWDLGEQLKVVFVSFTIDGKGVFDDAGERLFLFRIHWRETA
jgi:hypothetical protein